MTSSIQDYFNSFTAKNWKKAAFVVIGGTLAGSALYFTYKSYQQKFSNDQQHISKGKPQAIVNPQAKEQTKEAPESNEAANQRISKLAPVQQADAWKEKGNTAFKEGKREEARHYYTKAIEICPPNKIDKLAVYYQNRAATYDQKEQMNDIIEDCSKAISYNVKHGKAYRRRAAALEKKSDYKAALLDLTILCIIEQFQNFTTLAEADRLLKDYATQEARKLTQARNDSPIPVSINFARSYFDSYFNDPMVNRAKLISLDKSKDENYYIKLKEDENDTLSLVAFYLSQDRYDDAAKTCECETKEPTKQTLELLPTLMGLNMLRGQTTHSMKINEQFMSLFDKLINDGVIEMDEELIKLQTNAFIKCATAQMQRGDKDLAFEPFNKAVRADPNNCDTYFHRAQLKLVLDDIDGALADFTKTVELQPDHYLAMVQRDYSSYKQASKSQSPLQLNESIRKMEETIKTIPPAAEAFALMGQVYAERDDLDSAEELFRKAMHYDKTNGNYYVHLGLLKVGQQKVSEAFKLLRKSTEVDPHCSFGWETMGTMHVQTGNFQQALEYFDRALNLAKTELEATHTVGLKMAASAQFEALKQLGVRTEDMQQMNPFAQNA